MKLRTTERHDEEGNPVLEADPDITAEEFGEACGQIPHSGRVVVEFTGPPPKWWLVWTAKTEALSAAIDRMEAREGDGEDEE